MREVEIEIDLTEEDVRAGLLHTLLRQTPGLRAMPLMYLGAAAVLITGIVLLARGHRPTPPEFGFAALCAVYLVGVPAALRAFARTGLRGGAHATYLFGDDALRVQVGSERVEHAWKDIFQITETRRAFYVHPKPGLFHILPKRDLQDVDAVRREFATRVSRRRSALDWYSWLSPSLVFSLLLIVVGVLVGWLW